MEGQDVEIATSEASTVCTLHIRHLFRGSLTIAMSAELVQCSRSISTPCSYMHLWWLGFVNVCASLVAIFAF